MNHHNLDRLSEDLILFRDRTDYLARRREHRRRARAGRLRGRALRRALWRGLLLLLELAIFALVAGAVMALAIGRR